MNKPYSMTESLIGVIVVTIVTLLAFWFFGSTIWWVAKWLIATLFASLIQTIVVSVFFIFLVVVAKRYLPKNKDN